MHMHVTGFSAATILVFAIASPSRAQGIEVLGGYSVNADYVQNRPAILVVDQKVSPFFSPGISQKMLIQQLRQLERDGIVVGCNAGQPQTPLHDQCTGGSSRL